MAKNKKQHKKERIKKTRKINNFLRIFFPVLLLFVLLPLAWNYYSKSPINFDIRGKAEEESDESFCKNNCVENPCSAKALWEPCCEEIKKTGDPGACGWPARGWCYAHECASIPEDVRRERCAAPRQSWCEMCGARCQVGGIPKNSTPSQSPTQFPVPTVVAVTPTSIPFPTAGPTEVTIPTSFPPTAVIELPKSRPQITYAPIIIPPYTPPTVTPTPTPFKFTLPDILPSKEKVDRLVNSWKSALLQFLSTILP